MKRLIFSALIAFSSFTPAATVRVHGEAILSVDPVRIITKYDAYNRKWHTAYVIMSPESSTPTLLSVSLFGCDKGYGNLFATDTINPKDIRNYAWPDTSPTYVSMELVRMTVCSIAENK